MSTFPSIQTILLQIHQSLGCSPYPTKKKNNFAAGRMQISNHTKMGAEIIESIFDALDMAPEACEAALDNILNFERGYKGIELKTWTSNAGEHHILWELLGSYFVPIVSRHTAFWSFAEPLDKGMPGGRFWYLPELREKEGTPSLYLPIAQVVDWLLDLLGMPMDEFSSNRSQLTATEDEDDTDSLIRSLYNWRKATIPNPGSFAKYFPDNLNIEFRGAFELDRTMSHTEQFTEALKFIDKKGLTVESLKLEIPMTVPGRLEAILEGSAEDEEQEKFVTMLSERYAVPSPQTIRKRLLLARAIQDGYVRLLKMLCPGVDRLCADPKRNKLLQLFEIYKLVYNHTVAARNHCGQEGEKAEDNWFEEHLLLWLKQGPLLSITPSHRDISIKWLAMLLNRRFATLTPEQELEDHYPTDHKSSTKIAQRNIERVRKLESEYETQEKLINQLKTGSPWRILQREDNNWIVSQVVQTKGIAPRVKEAAIKRLRELASSPSEVIPAILLELDHCLNDKKNLRAKGTQERVKALIDEVEVNHGYSLWEAPILQYKGKHLLACNDFSGAEKQFRMALDACGERNYGPLRGECARDLLAISVADQKLIPENHERYYREMLAGGMNEGENIPGIEDTARWASDYFWENLYVPYTEVVHQKRRAEQESKRIFGELMGVFKNHDKAGLVAWITNNRKLLQSRLPDVNGDSILMMLIKARARFIHELPALRRLCPTGKVGDIQQIENVLEFWITALREFVSKAPAKQLNITDLKGQTPLMLVAEEGNTQLVKLMLHTGADPDIQDYHGRTALVSAIKSGVTTCIDALLDYPCCTNKIIYGRRSVLHTAAWTCDLHSVKRLLELAPLLAWQRDDNGDTPLEYVERLLEDPTVLQDLTKKLTENGRRTPSKEEFKAVVSMLENAPQA